MRDRRLQEMLRDPRAHAPVPQPAELRALQDAVLARHAAESARDFAHASAQPPPRAARLRWIERAAVAAGLLAVVVAASSWLGEFWSRSREALAERLPEPPAGGWSAAFAEAFAAQPLLWSGVLLAAALLLVRPVREALLREIR